MGSCRVDVPTLARWGQVGLMWGDVPTFGRRGYVGLMYLQVLKGQALGPQSTEGLHEEDVGHQHGDEEL